MNSRQLALIIAAIAVMGAGIMGAVLFTAYQLRQIHQEQTDVIYRYAIISPDDENLLLDLNSAGSKGFGAVSASRTTDRITGEVRYEIFLQKRVVKEPWHDSLEGSPMADSEQRQIEK